MIWIYSHVTVNNFYTISPSTTIIDSIFDFLLLVLIRCSFYFGSYNLLLLICVHVLYSPNKNFFCSCFSHFCFGCKVRVKWSFFLDKTYTNRIFRLHQIPHYSFADLRCQFSFSECIFNLSFYSLALGINEFFSCCFLSLILIILFQPIILFYYWEIFSFVTNSLALEV